MHSSQMRRACFLRCETSGSPQPKRTSIREDVSGRETIRRSFSPQALRGEGGVSDCVSLETSDKPARHSRTPHPLPLTLSPEYRGEGDRLRIRPTAFPDRRQSSDGLWAYHGLQTAGTRSRGKKSRSIETDLSASSTPTFHEPSLALPKKSQGIEHPRIKSPRTATDRPRWEPILQLALP